MNKSISRKDPLSSYLILRFRPVFLSPKKLYHIKLFSVLPFVWTTCEKPLYYSCKIMCEFYVYVHTIFVMLFLALRLNSVWVMRTLNGFCMSVLLQAVVNLWNVLCVQGWEINPLELSVCHISPDITVNNWVLSTWCVCAPHYSYNTEWVFYSINLIFIKGLLYVRRQINICR